MKRNREKMLYLECRSGISGDMMAAALLDLGADKDKLYHVLESLEIKGFDVEITRKKRANLDVCDFYVKLDSEHENHDHDMEYLHGEEHEDTPYDTENHNHEYRNIEDINQIINGSLATKRAKKTAEKIFDILADAEAKSHGTTKDQVHFHEVGALDSIIDILAVAVCLDDLNITNCAISSICEGKGTIRCQHGILPIPVPAVVNISEKYGLPLSFTNIRGELVTPTGAAIAAAIRTHDKLPDTFVIDKTGLGGGKRAYSHPSILRAMLISPGEALEEDIVYKLETNIDDCTGESLGYTMERLLEAGARDVNYTPVFMKKNRPAYELHVICDKEDVSKMEDIIFMETTTIGIRRQKMERRILKRDNIVIATSLGSVKVKECKVGNVVRRYPEYDSVAQISRKTNRSYQEVLHIIEKEI